MVSRSYRTLLFVFGMFFASACTMIVAPDRRESEEVATALNVDSVKQLNAGGSANEEVIGSAGISGSIVLPETDISNVDVVSVMPQDQVVDVVQNEATIDVDFFIDHAFLVLEIITKKMEKSDTSPNFNAVEFSVTNQRSSVSVRVIEAMVCQNPKTIASVKLMRISILSDGVELLASVTVDDQGCWKLIPTKANKIFSIDTISKLQIQGVLDTSSVDPTNMSYYIGLYNQIGSLTILSLTGIVFSSTLSSETFSAVNQTAEES